jgi:hypothetical protein
MAVGAAAPDAPPRWDRENCESPSSQCILFVLCFCCDVDLLGGLLLRWLHMKCTHLVPAKAPLPEEAIFNRNKAAAERRCTARTTQHKECKIAKRDWNNNRIKRRKAGERGVSSNEDPLPEPSWSGDIASAVVDWSHMLGSSSSSPLCTAEVSSSRQPQMAVRDKNMGSSLRPAACPARKGQRTVRPRAAPSETGASESQRAAPRQADPLRGGQRSNWLLSANSSMVPTALTRTPCRGAGHGRGRRIIIGAECTAGGGFWRRHVATAVITYLGQWSPECSSFPRRWQGSRTHPGYGGGRTISSRVVGGAQHRCQGGGRKWRSFQVGGLQARSPRAGLVGPPSEEVPSALQDVSSRPRSLHHELFDLSCLLTLILSSRKHADTGVLSLAPLRRLALSTRVMPSEPRPNLHALSRFWCRSRRGWPWPLWWKHRARRPYR